MKYIITFYTHFGAMMTEKKMKQNNIACKISPVPRYISSSCGSCVFYEGDDIYKDMIDKDFEAIFVFDEELKKYKLIFENN